MRRSAQSAEDFHLPSLTFEHRSAGETALSTLRRTIETDCSQEPEALSLGDLEFKDPSANTVGLFGRRMTMPGPPDYVSTPLGTAQVETKWPNIR